MSVRTFPAITINERKTFLIKVNLCAPWITASPSATASPIFSKIFNFPRYDAFGPNPIDDMPTYPPVMFTEYQGNPLKYYAYNKSEPLLWSGTPVPDVSLPASFDSTQGVVTVAIPFGLTYVKSRFEWLPGSHPSRYSVSIRLGSHFLASGIVDVQEPSPPPTQIAVACSISSSFEQPAGAAPATPSGSPWLIG